MRIALLGSLLFGACSSKMLVMVEEGPGQPETVRVAALHLKSVNRKRPTQAAADELMDENLANIERLVRMAAGAGAKIVVVPEYGITGVAIKRKERKYVSTMLPEAPTEKAVADLKDDRIASHIKHCSAVARELEIYLVANVMEREMKLDDDGVEEAVYYNSMVAFDPKGRLVARYRKINLYFFEQFIETHGTEEVSFDTPYGRFGMLMCLDCIVPWTFSKLASEHDIDAFVVNSLWENTPFIGRIAMNIMSNTTGRPVIWSNQRRLPFASGAGFVRPWGDDFAFGTLGPTGVVVANMKLPARLRKKPTITEVAATTD